MGIPLYIKQMSIGFKSAECMSLCYQGTIVNTNLLMILLMIKLHMSEL